MADYRDINTVSKLRQFDVELAEVTQKYVQAHKPFDEQCARLDFKDRLAVLERESERKNGFIKMDEIKIEAGNLDKYGADDRFEFIHDEATFDDKISEDGKKTKGIIGHTIDYKCKQRGHGVSVFVPLDEYEEKKGKKKADK